MTVTIGRRELLAALGGAVAWPFAASAQQPAVKIPRGVTQIGILWPVDDDQVLAAFRQALRELGYGALPATSLPRHRRRRQRRSESICSTLTCPDRRRRAPRCVRPSPLERRAL